MDLKSSPIHFVSSTESPEFNHLNSSLTRSSLVGLDAEWKPVRTQQSTFPTVSLLQIACRLIADETESVVFLLDLSTLPLSSIYELLKQMLESPNILKLGFRFKQDLKYLSSTFVSQGCEPGFEKVEPYLDIASIYNVLQNKQKGRELPKQSKSLAAICKDVLGISLSKELQCSDWSCRPLSEEQIQYAAEDANCLLKIFDVLRCKFCKEGNSFYDAEIHPYNVKLGLKLIMEESDTCNVIMKTKFCNALEIVQATVTDFPKKVTTVQDSDSSRASESLKAIDGTVLHIIRRYGDKIVLKLSDRKPKGSKKKEKRQTSSYNKEKRSENIDEYEGPPPWDMSLGGDGCPKFLCDVMIEGLAKHLRCVGIDAAVPYTKKPNTRDLIEQADKEKRVLLTRDAKLLRHKYLIQNQIYLVKSLLKNDQLVEVIHTFQLNISEDNLMSRCAKCNGRFIQRPLSTEEAIEVAKGFQVIPNCLFNKNVEFWQCKDCNQLYWEGTQYHNAVQKFIDVCKLN
ncbi:3'-5' exonuclease domain-containing protein [Heracleum sosnowskyi]|uniref:3'-5' exonuclease domain-containing protein n=1 Tax=Heracleum sosnowskyi TaxID=360622 RepID=A0AAD8H7U2_9APIA|nr:3'-5' exonuclease domain-containing protein [Heracleum sosnowskyi]